MKYVAVKHQPDNEMAYWFEVPQGLENVVSVGKDVICNTKHGDMPGRIVSIIDSVPLSEATRIIGNRFPLKNVIAVAMEFELSEIYVPWDIERILVHPTEIAARVDELYEHGGFKVPISFSSDGRLVEGYSAYLVAKMFEHETLKGYCVSSQ